MKKSITIFLLLLMVCSVSSGKLIYPKSNTASNTVELTVEGIERICPTGLWDSWIFKEIVYDRDLNTVFWVIQPYKKIKNLDKTTSPEEVKKITTAIIEEILKGYNDVIENPGVNTDGDFMLYLSLNTLLKEMEKNKSNLQVVFLNPDKMNLINDTPAILDYTEISKIYEADK